MGNWYLLRKFLKVTVIVALPFSVPQSAVSDNLKFMLSKYRVNYISAWELTMEIYNVIFFIYHFRNLRLNHTDKSARALHFWNTGHETNN
jgi:hypothetical protein